MTNVINTAAPGALASEATTAEPVTARTTTGAASAPVAETEAVTLSPDAQAAAQLLSAAQESDGVDVQTVATLKAALESGSYNVAPEDLAQAIATVLKETS